MKLKFAMKIHNSISDNFIKPTICVSFSVNILQAIQLHRTQKMYA